MGSKAPGRQEAAIEFGQVWAALGDGYSTIDSIEVLTYGIFHCRLTFDGLFIAGTVAHSDSTDRMIERRWAADQYNRPFCRFKAELHVLHGHCRKI